MGKAARVHVHYRLASTQKEVIILTTRLERTTITTESNTESDTSTDKVSQTEDEEIVLDPIEPTNMSTAQEPATPTIAAPTAISDNPPLPEPSQIYTTFTLFPSLPPEIRLHIWKCMFPGPRILHINYNIHNIIARYSHYRGRQCRGQWTIFDGVNTSDLPTLRICQESRFETFNSGYELPHGLEGGAWSFWFNYNTDTMFFNSNASRDSTNIVLPPRWGLPVRDSVAAEVTRVAVGLELWQSGILRRITERMLRAISVQLKTTRGLSSRETSVGLSRNWRGFWSRHGRDGFTTETRFKKILLSRLGKVCDGSDPGKFEMFKFGAEVEMVDAKQIGPVADD